MNMVSAAYKVMQHQQKFEDEDPAAADGNAQAEALRLMLDAMWAANALDIQTIVSKVCQTVRVLHFVPVLCTVLNCLEAIKALLFLVERETTAFSDGARKTHHHSAFK
jgi:hypothetical protein